MRSNWEGNLALQDFVRRVDPGAALVAQVVRIEDEGTVYSLRSEWAAGTVTGGSVEILDAGGARLQASSTAALTFGTDDGTDATQLTHLPPFSALRITWLDNDSDRQVRNLIARLDARDDGGQPVEVYEWRAQLFRVIEIDAADVVRVAPISQEVVVLATGEAPADVTFDFFDPSAPGGGPYPRVGAPAVDLDEPSAEGRAQTIVRVIALQDDGTPAGNVTWLADGTSSGSETDSSTYLVEHLQYLSAEDSPRGEFVGGTVWETGALVSSMPRFTLNQADYTAATITFDGTEEVADPGGTAADESIVVARGSTPYGTALTFEINDQAGSGWVECFDGDVIGEDNTAQGGGDLSSVGAGPWDMRVTLTPDAAGLATPYVRDIGVERIQITDLAGMAQVEDGARQVDPQTLKGNIPRATISILITGERDYRDYGSRLLSQNHIGDIEVRVYVGDATGEHLSRRDWMRHSVWEVEDYDNDGSAHVIYGISPMKRLRKRIPRFVPSTGQDGDRTAVEYTNQTGVVVYDDLMDNEAALPGRYRGPGIEDTTHTIGKTLKRIDAKDILDEVCFLFGYALIESQGQVKAVRVIRDDAGAGVPVAFFPIGSYSPVRISPGYRARTDEYFVRYNWVEAQNDFEDERRYVNATALGRLGGAGIETTDELDASISEWISTLALADDIGRRVPAHFGNGLIVWDIAPIDRHPQLEPGDVVAVETDRFVARSPIDERELRGPLYALGMIVKVGDHWGHDLSVWVPSFDKIVVLEGTTTLDGFLLFDLALDFTLTYIPTGATTGNLRIEYVAGADVGNLRIDVAFFDGLSVQSWTYDQTVTERDGEEIIQEDPIDGTDPYLFAAFDTLLIIDVWGQTAAGGQSGLRRRRSYDTVVDVAVPGGNQRAIQGATDIVGEGLRVGQAGYLALSTVSGDPEVELSMAVFDAGAQGANFSLDYDDGPAQTASITTDVELTDILNLDGSTPFSARISCGANTLTLNATNFEGPTLSFTGVVSLSFMDFGTGSIAVAGVEY